MDILTCMSLGGSLMVLFYIILKAINKNKWSYQERWIFLIGAIVVFLVPYPQERHQYIGLLQWLFANAEWTYSFNDKVANDNFYIIENAAGEVLLRHDVRFYIIACFIVIGLIVIFGRQLYLNQKVKKDWICFGREESSRKLWHRDIKVYSTNEVEEPLSVGVLDAVIVIPETNLSPTEKEMVIQHEMQHIRGGDLILNCICVVLISIHWFNPLVYYLVKELRHVQELRCDAKVIKNMDKEERYQYANLILQFVRKKDEKRPLISTLSGSGKRVNERINEIMMNKKVKVRISMVVVLLVSVFMSTLTALAYSPAEVFEKDDDMSLEEAQRFVENAVFIPEGEECIFLQDETIGLVVPGKSVFKAEDGSVYYYDENESELYATSCTHNYVAGTYYEHVENGAGCIVNVYDGKRCTKCGVFRKTSKINTITYATCPH